MLTYEIIQKKRQKEDVFDKITRMMFDRERISSAQSWAPVANIKRV